MSPHQADPEQHKRRASRKFGSLRQQGVDNGATDVEAGFDLHSTGRKSNSLCNYHNNNRLLKKPTSSEQNQFSALSRRQYKGCTIRQHLA
jgi:hypothetical protein